MLEGNRPAGAPDARDTAEDGPGPATHGRGRPPMTERRRAWQRLAISREAVRLFCDQGVAATSTEQIAEAVALSERTVRRYFQAKEYSAEPLLSVAVDRLTNSLLRWPLERSLEEHLESERPGQDALEDREAVFAIIALTRSEPAIRAIWLFLFERATATLADVVARRLDRSPGDLAVRVQAGTLAVALRITIEDFAAELTHRVPMDDSEFDRRLADAIDAAAQGVASKAVDR